MPYYTKADLETFAGQLGIFSWQTFQDLRQGTDQNFNTAFTNSLPPEVSLQPDVKAVVAATADVSVALQHLADSGKRDSYVPKGNPESIATTIEATKLKEMLSQRGHSAWISGWAIYGLIEKGLLGAEVARLRDDTPILREADDLVEVLDSLPWKPSENDVNEILKPDRPLVIGELSYLVVWPTKVLQEWWRDHPDAMFSPPEPAKADQVERSDQSTPETPLRGEAADLTAFRPAKEFLGQRGFEKHSQLSKFLSNHREEIRTHKPNPQRNMVHAGDWNAYWEKVDERNFEMLDTLEGDYIPALNQRAAAIKGERRLKRQEQKQERRDDPMTDIIDNVQKRALDEIRAREPGK
jgi:hypothetical protein